MIPCYVGGVGGILHGLSDMERLFREHSSDVDRVWIAVDLRSVLSAVSAETRLGPNAVAGRRQLPQESTQHCQTGRLTV